MPTILDSFVIEFGLDHSKFDKGQKELADNMRKSNDGLREQGNQTEDIGRKMGDAFDMVSRKLLAVGALLMGGRGLAEFAMHVNSDAAAVGRLSYTVDLSSQELSNWRGMAARAGGTAQGMTASIQSMTNSLQTGALTGDSPLLQYFRALGIDVGDANGKLKKTTDLMLELSDKLQGMDPARATAIGKAFGFDDGTINVLLRGRSAISQLIAEQQKLNSMTREETDAANALESAWSAVTQAFEGAGRAVLTTLTPALTTLGNALAREMTDEGAFLKDLNSIQDPALYRRALLAWAVGDKLAGISPQERAAIRNAREQRDNAQAAAGPSPLPSASVGGGAFTNQQEKAAFIVSEANRLGVDPAVALQVAKSEGFNDYTGDRGSSFGAFQLHYGGMASGGMAGKGLGDDFTKETGLDAKNPATERQQITFALQKAREGGWGPWHGWKGDRWAGIPTGAGGLPRGSGGGSTVTNTTHIDQVVVNTQATDGAGVARDFSAAVQRNSAASSAQGGPR